MQLGNRGQLAADRVFETQCGAVFKSSKLRDRLSQYWKIELVNVFMLPVVTVVVVTQVFKAPVTVALVLSLLATAGLLVIGTIALRMMFRQYEGDRECASYWLPILDRAQNPALLLVMASIGTTATGLFASYPKFDAADIAALIFTLLATLEYINYYHRQLQHFDHWSDFRRLRAGQGWRKSHLARALARWRKQRHARRRSAAND